MFFISLVLFLIAVILSILLFTQIVMPAFLGGRYFSLFRTTPLQDELAITRETVSDLKEHTAALTELNVLKKQQASLDAERAQFQKKEK